jgi:hypothetical protein
LAALLADHGVWQDVKVWRELITEIMQYKITESDRIRKRKSLAMESQQNSKEKNFFKKGFKQLKGMLQTTKDKQTI